MAPLAQPVPTVRREKLDPLVLPELLVLEAPRVNVERQALLDPLDSPAPLVLMASLVPKVNKEKPARKVTLVPPVLRAPLELLGLRVLLV